MADNSRESTNLPGTDGLLLSDWDLVSIDDVAIQVGSGVTPRGGRESYLNSGVPLVRSQNVLMNRLDLSDVAFIGEDVHEQMSRSSLRPGDVLLNITGASIGRVAVVPSELKVANVNQHVCKIRLNDYCDPSFVAFYLSTAMGQAQVLGNQYGATRQGLNYGQVRQLRIPHPPIPEHRAIAHVLRTVQRAKEATEKVIAATRQLKASLMRHLFTYGPVPVDQADRVRLKETEVGLVPEHWQVVSIAGISEVKTSTASVDNIPGRSEAASGVPVFFLKVSDMNLPGNERVFQNAANIVYINQAHEKRLNAVPAGSTVLPKRGAAIATNKKRLTKCKCLLDPNLMAIVPGNQITSGFLFAWMERFDLRTITDTTTLPQLTKKDIEPLKVTL